MEGIIGDGDDKHAEDYADKAVPIDEHPGEDKIDSIILKQRL